MRDITQRLFALEEIARAAKQQPQPTPQPPPPQGPPSYDIGSPVAEGVDRAVPESPEETPWQRIIHEGVAGRAPQPQAGAYPYNAPQAARDQQPGMPQYAPQNAQGQPPGVPQQPSQWQGAPVPPPPQPTWDFNTRLPGDDAEPNVNSIFRAPGMQQTFVAGGQDVLKTSKIDRKFVDLKKISGVAADWRNWKKT